MGHGRGVPRRPSHWRRLPYLDGNATETFELMLTTEGRVARKTYLCDEPTVSAERACLGDLVKRLFPN